MNKKAGYALRIVLGVYLAYLGIRMLIQMADERPSNMVFISVMAVIFTVVGTAYAIYSVKKLWDVRKEEGAIAGAAEEETEALPEEEPDEEMTETAEEQEQAEEMESDYEEK